MEDMITPYELPEVENHSFFFIDQRIEAHIEAKLHQHDAWELYYVLHGHGTRMAGDTLQPLTDRTVVIVEDIVDTGLTMQRLLDTLGTRGPREIHIFPGDAG